MCTDLIYCTCEVHDLVLEERRAEDPEFSEPAIRKAYLLPYGPGKRRLSLRPVCELCEEFVNERLMDIEMAIKHRNLARGFRSRPKPVRNEDPAEAPSSGLGG